MEGRKMEKTIIILSILFTLVATIVTAALYEELDQIDKVETVTMEQLYDRQFPEGMADVAMIAVPVSPW